MKAMKKLTAALLTAAMLTANPGAIHAFAEEAAEDYENYQYDEWNSPYELTTDGFGTMYYQSRQWQRKRSFIAVTTADGLTEPIVDEDGDINTFTEWKDYKPEDYTAALDTGVLYQKYGEDVRIYLVTSQLSYHEGLQWVCREFALRNATVLAAMPLESKEEGTCTWDGSVTLGCSPEYAESVTDETADRYSEAHAFLIENSQLYKEWAAKYMDWYENVNTPSMTGRERIDSLNAAGIADPYTVMMGARERARDFRDAHADMFDFFSVGIKSLETPLMIYQTYSAWSYMGDIDDDGAVTSADAAEMLKAGAYRGAGKDSGLSLGHREAGDLNCDYRINAEDAALALMYAADQGADPGDGDIGDFILRQYRGR